MQIAKCCCDVKGHVKTLSEKGTLLSFHINGALKVSPMINLVLQCTLQSVEQQEVTTLFHTGKSGCSGRRHSTKLDNVWVRKRRQKLGLLHVTHEKHKQR
jgi:hypothetical protein